MKKLKQNQMGPWCSFCGNKKTRATHREHGFHGMFCCEEHKEELLKHEESRFLKDKRITEADRQTWMRV